MKGSAGFYAFFNFSNKRTMIISDSFDLENLSKYGFKKFDIEDCSEEMEYMKIDWVMDLGHSRRGQFYYLIVSQMSLKIFASKPDGSGGSLAFPQKALDAILSMKADGVFA
jgi:hypothetical protein